MTARPELGISLTQQYEALVLCVCALQLPISIAEQLEFLNDALDACDRLDDSFEMLVIGAEKERSP